MLVYISGPMTGKPNNNRDAFNEAEALFRSMGLAVFNPASLDVPDGSFEHYMQRDIPLVLLADAIAILPGWSESRGSLIEISTALAVGKPVYSAETGERIEDFFLGHGGAMLTVGVSKEEYLRDTCKTKKVLPLIGITGFKGSGKDTVGDYIAKKYGYEKNSFAAALKEDIRVAHSPDVSSEEWLTFIDANKYKSVTEKGGWVRPILQSWGVAKREQDEDYWVKKVALGPRIVITDVRFPNEASAIKKAGGVLILIERPGLSSDGHPSENHIPHLPIDYIVCNDSSLPILEARVDEVLLLCAGT